MVFLGSTWAISHSSSSTSARHAVGDAGVNSLELTALPEPTPQPLALTDLQLPKAARSNRCCW